MFFREEIETEFKDALVTWFDNVFDYTNGEREGWLQAEGTFDKKTGILSGVIFEDMIAIDNFKVKFFFDRHDKIAYMMSMKGSYQDFGYRAITLEDLKDNEKFHLGELVLKVINHIMCPYLGPGWKTRPYGEDISDNLMISIIQEKKDIIGAFTKGNELNGDICKEIITHYVNEYLNDMIAEAGRLYDIEQEEREKKALEFVKANPNYGRCIICTPRPL